MTLTIGHRGASAHAPENTLLAINKAFEMGCDAVEIDVHKCASGELVVHHDDTLERTTNGQGNVKDKTLDELKELDAGDGEKIPTLSEVLAIIPKGRKVLIEAKQSDIAKDLAKAITPSEDIIVISFDYDFLRKLKATSPKMNVGASFEEEMDWDKVVDIELYSVNPKVKILTKDIVDEAHVADIKVFTWTVRDDEGLERALESDPDGIMFDDPLMAKEIF